MLKNNKYYKYRKRVIIWLKQRKQEVFKLPFFKEGKKNENKERECEKKESKKRRGL